MLVLIEKMCKTVVLKTVFDDICKPLEGKNTSQLDFQLNSLLVVVNCRQMVSGVRIVRKNPLLAKIYFDNTLHCYELIFILNKRSDTRFLCVCPVIENVFLRNIVKLVCKRNS